MPVTFHSYDDASDTPESVQGLVELMKRPLRNTQRLASLPSMSPLALAQLQRIPDRGSDADASTSEGSLNKISSVANLVLLTSKAIEESVHDRIEARRTISTSSTTQARAQSVPVLKKGALTPKGTKTKSGSRFSCSTFANEPAQSVVRLTDSNPTITSWMLHRFVFTLTRMPGWEPSNNSPPRFQDMMNAYEELSCPSWPKHWTALETLPQVDSCLTLHRKKLLEGHMKMRQAGTEIADLDEDLAKIMESRLSLLLKTAAGAYTKEARPISALEAESRHEFDALFCNFFVDDVRQVTSPDVLFERPLRLPLNTLLEGLKSKEPDKCAKQLTRGILAWVSHNQSVWDHLQQTREAEDITAQASQTQTACVMLSSSFTKIHPLNARTTAKLRRAVEPQSTREPNRGVCDAIMVTLVPLPTEGKAKSSYKNSRFVVANYKHSTRKVKKPEKRNELGKVQEHNESEEDEESKDSSTDGETRKSKQETGQEQETEPPEGPIEMFILLPQISVEYKKPTDTETKVLNQARIHCVSNTIYLGTLGIRNFPVFSLPVHGTRASLIMAWKADNDNVYLVERNVRKFDILDPIQAFHLATVILRIKARERELIKLYNEHKEPYETKLKAGTCDIWAMPESKTTVASPPSTGALTSTNEVAE